MESTCLHQYLTGGRSSVSACGTTDSNSSGFKAVAVSAMAVLCVVGAAVGSVPAQRC